MSGIYNDSRETAVKNGELEYWYRSQGLNLSCKKMIEGYIQLVGMKEEAVAESFGGIAAQVIEEFGFDRVMRVLANTIQHRQAAFGEAERQWAAGFSICREEAAEEYVVRHKDIQDICSFLSQVRERYAALGLLNRSACKAGFLDYEKQILLLKPVVLSDKYKLPAYQLFYADMGGFGCSPSASGRKVMGHFLKDGEQATFYREDFLGVVKEEALPQWAKEHQQRLDVNSPHPMKLL